jgi:glycosyltransferase involved in cell wall biosynthesis
VLQDPELYDPTATTDEERAERVRALGAEVTRIRSDSTGYFRGLGRTPAERLRRSVSPLDEELFPHLVDGPAVREAVEASGADVAFVYHHEMLAASRGLAIPRLAAVGDPPHLSALHRFRAELPDPRALRRLNRLQSQLRRQPRLFVELLNECAGAGAFAAHHAAWLRARGVRHCEYLRTPVPDPTGPEWREARELHAVERPRILLLGHMKGVVTLEGLQTFATEILPRLERELGSDGFDVRIAGGYDPPQDLADALDRPSVRLLGHVEEPSEEFLSAHAMLVPNSITLGIRVRIVTGFSFGSCIVSHRANTLGIPELEHGVNALIADDAEGLANGVLHAVRDASLRRRLEAGSRATYERAFTPAVAAGRIEAKLRAIAPEPASTSASPA